MIALLSNKWMIGVYVLLGILVILYVIGRKSVHTEIIISASPDMVWSVLMDGPGYQVWNPVLVSIEGEIKEGNTLKYNMIQPDGKSSVVSTKVVKTVSNEMLNQFGGIPGILTFDHRYMLEVVEGGTKVTIHEDYRGVGVIFWDASWVEPSYAKANEGLKKRVEALGQ